VVTVYYKEKNYQKTKDKKIICDVKLGFESWLVTYKEDINTISCLF